MGVHKIGSIRQRPIQEELGDGDTCKPRSLGQQVIVVSCDSNFTALVFRCNRSSCTYKCSRPDTPPRKLLR